MPDTYRKIYETHFSRFSISSPVDISNKITILDQGKADRKSFGKLATACIIAKKLTPGSGLGKPWPLWCRDNLLLVPMPFPAGGIALSNYYRANFLPLTFFQLNPQNQRSSDAVTQIFFLLLDEPAKMNNLIAIERPSFSKPHIT